ncbi:MAG: hypothetical protein J6W00_02355 [Lentisphaeria bacterium]|nr:hypothetical protein [Lentisphaeria bacterium]
MIIGVLGFGLLVFVLYRMGRPNSSHSCGLSPDDDNRQPKKYLMSYKEREEFCNLISTLEFRWTISRERDTYGYNICSLWINGVEKVASTCGGGCDMKGTVLAAFIREYFPEQLKKMDSGKHYGLTFWDPNGKGVRGRYLKHYKEGCKFYLDGACGFREMEHFLKEIGFYLGNPIINKANTQVYQFKAYEEEKQSGLRHTL